MLKYEIDIDIFKQITGNYYLNEDEGNPDDFIEIIGSSCFLNHKAIGGISNNKIMKMVKLQEKRKKGMINNESS